LTHVLRDLMHNGTAHDSLPANRGGERRNRDRCSCSLCQT
jgi:hypothetical protein